MRALTIRELAVVSGGSYGDDDIIGREYGLSGKVGPNGFNIWGANDKGSGKKGKVEFQKGTGDIEINCCSLSLFGSTIQIDLGKLKISFPDNDKPTLMDQAKDMYGYGQVRG